MSKYLAHYRSAGDFTHHYGDKQRVYEMDAKTWEEAHGEAIRFRSDFKARTQLDVASISIYAVAESQDFDLNAWRRAQWEEKDRAEYERLKAKFEGGQS